MKNFIYVLIILCLFGCSSPKEKENIDLDSNDILTSSEANEMILQGAVLIDVRTVSEYREGHIEGAVSLPLDLINDETVSDIVPSKDINIIVYCASGNRSASAKTVLKDLGYQNVFDLGSINNWKEN